MVHFVNGDIVDLIDSGNYNIAFHGCNCYATMGSGVARGLSLRWGKVRIVDTKTPYGMKSKLGTYSRALISPRIRDGRHKFCLIYNIYTQFGVRRWEGHEDIFEYEHYETALKSMREEIEESLKSKDKGRDSIHIIMPKIGSMRAGGDWDRILKITKEILGEYDLTIVNYVKGLDKSMTEEANANAS
jgi:O-acetyl-ADP-ribose deacetylase (regulator of RNase III)